MSQPIVRIEAIITSVDYSDFLLFSLPKNKKHFDAITVLTAPRDKFTQETCKYYGVDYITTSSFFRNGAPFNKGQAMNIGVANSHYQDWILFLDGDIVLPDNFRESLLAYGLNYDYLYGVNRFKVVERSKFKKIDERCPGIKGDLFYLRNNPVPPEYPLLPNCTLPGEGYPLPIGFFQLFHYSRLRQHNRKYPEVYPTAGLSDLYFAAQWEEQNRLLIPDAAVMHLQTKDLAPADNWAGRTTEKF